MQEARSLRFDTRAELALQWQACLAAAHTRLDLFDPDFAVFALGTSEVDAALRTFFARGGVLRLALHSPAHVERHYPRFLRLLRDFSHRAECRATPQALHHLTDSFCIADNRHVVRRFHSDHLRGEAAFDSPGAVEVPRQRFDAIWDDSFLTLQSTKTGL
ncbi:hypothetical protein [Massilia sp. H6]|uniref:DUF7931 domain-containing protein n=1 Tax=Massilia sp. H6 TaxID=2970464 RepID=UPI0021691455|nr:hypothetical protein [Massilia sp. H6]UVW27781.1 hypothetical protein NRS07_14680 [Massilia sp. H6]